MHKSSLNDHLGREQIENCIFRSNLADMMRLLISFSALWANYCFHSLQIRVVSILASTFALQPVKRVISATDIFLLAVTQTDRFPFNNFKNITQKF